MSVNYDLYETPDLAKSGEEQPLHARVVLKGSYTAEEFVEQVTAFQHMPHAQVVGIIEAISKELRHLLLKGFSVELGDIGYFTLSLSVDKKVMESKELRSPSVSLKDVNFRVNRQFKKDIESELKLQLYKVFRRTSVYQSAGLCTACRKDKNAGIAGYQLFYRARDIEKVWIRTFGSIYKRGVNLHNPGESKLSNYELSYYTSTCWMGYHIDRLPLFPVFSFEKGYADGKCFCR